MTGDLNVVFQGPVLPQGRGARQMRVFCPQASLLYNGILSYIRQNINPIRSITLAVAFLPSQYTYSL